LAMGVAGILVLIVILGVAFNGAAP